MPFKVEPDVRHGLLRMRLEGILAAPEMELFLREHNAGVDSFRGAPYRVLCDIRGMKPLSPESTELFETAKRYSAAHPNFKGSAVLVDSSLVAMQHQRTSISSGVMPTELITHDERACDEHLEKLKERASAPPRP